MASDLPPRCYLHRLEIREYEQFKNCPPIEFSPGHNLLLGINGSGKTCLLKLIHAVLSSDYRSIADRTFDVACW